MLRQTVNICSYLVVLAGLLFQSALAQLPEGFDAEPVVESLESPGGIRFLNDSTALIWSMDGKVYVMINDVEPSSAIINISDEVGQWGDHGMLGFAVHPQFAQNGLIYLLYTVDHYHLLHSDDPDYDPNASQNYKASIGRLTRYQLDINPPHLLVPESREILIGSEMDNGIPQMSASHGVGSLEFGSDGSLLVSCGDGSTWVGTFNGGPPYPQYAFDEAGLDLGILRPEENLGSFRSQFIDSYNGKLLRIDALTGLGLPSNPFYDSEHPDLPKSKVWSLGFRNPFRIALRPGTGSSIQSSGNPGTFFVSDVGYTQWEEINVVDGPALNHGWPLYEGQVANEDFTALPTYHPHYVNPLSESCSISNYRFQDLIIQPSEDHVYSWVNPCDNLVTIEDSLLKFVHARPQLAYGNQVTEHDFDVVVPGFDGEGLPYARPIEEMDGFSEPSFKGSASIAGDFYYGTSFPEEYFGTFFQSDYNGWVRTFWFDSNNEVTDIRLFTDQLGPIVSTRFNPYDDNLYMTSAFPQTIYRISFGGNVKPNAVIVADTIYGNSPLTVFLDASSSYDPDGDPISYDWALGDGTERVEESFTHTFSAPGSSPYTYYVTLAVTDSTGNVDYAEQIISLNNTPPIVDITSLSDSSLYSIYSTTLAPLIAQVQDAEHKDDELLYEWQTIQRHNSHEHPNPFDNSHVTETVFEPAGCLDFATYSYSVSLRVTDPGGLSGFDEVRVFPDCDAEEPEQVAFSQWTAYPNPSTGYFTLRGPAEIGTNIKVEVWEVMGRALYSETSQVDEFGRLSLELRGNKPGHYIARISGEGFSTTVPIVIAPSP